MTTPISQPIIIVSGLPRSGTSMMMQMLEAGGVPVLGDDHRQPDEDNPKGYYEFELAKRTTDDPSWLKAAHGKAVKAVYMLLYDFPPEYTYRIIFMQRPITEVVASQQAMLKRTGRQGASLDDDAIARLFVRELDRIEHWLTLQTNVSVRHVDYHDVLRDPDEECAAIAAFLGMNLNVPAMTASVDASLYRQKARKPGVKPWMRRKVLWCGLAGLALLVIAAVIAGMVRRDLSARQAISDDVDGPPDAGELERLRSLPYVR